jgi:hypothetical protein
MKQVVCDDEKCTIETMPRITQKGRGGGGLNPEGSSYLIPVKSSSQSKLVKKRKTRGRKVQRGRGSVKSSSIQTGKGKRRRRKSVSQPKSVKGGRRKRKCVKKSRKRR